MDDVIDAEEAVALLKRSLAFLNDIPNRSMRGDRTQTTYGLAADIDRFFAKEGIR